LIRLDLQRHAFSFLMSLTVLVQRVAHLQGMLVALVIVS
jgi:hypothetical protein